jgi:putative heme utilization carrier protein HutX
VSLLDVFRRLPRAEVRFLPGSAFEGLWEHLSSWGEVLFIVHTTDIVLECTGTLPPGTSGQGYFNIHGDSPIGGHIKASNCATIVLVDRLFHGRRSCSFQFLNGEGNAMFKIFVRRGKARELDPLQLAKFDAVFSSRAHE